MLTLVLSIIGVVTGFAGLMLHFYKFIGERPKLRIHTKYENGKVYFDANQHIDKIQSPMRLIIYANIENPSDKPLTITEFTFKSEVLDKPLSSQFGIEPSDNYEFAAPDGTIWGINAKSKHLPNMTEIKGRSAVEGFIFFPFCPCIQLDSINGTLCVCTPCKTFKKKVTLHLTHSVRPLLKNTIQI
jgi:hypothetical protein